MDQNNTCNLRCRMCAFSDPRTRSLPRYDLPFALFEKIVREVLPRARYLALSCLTEPLMTRDFAARLELLRADPVPLSEMITNGMLLTEALVETLVDLPLTRIGISVDGARAATYERIRVGASFDRLMRAIASLNAAKAHRGSEHPHLRLDFVLSETNMGEFEEFLALAERCNAQGVDVRTIAPFRGAADQGTEAVSFWEQVRCARETLTAWSARTGIADLGYLRTRSGEIVLYEDGKRLTCRRPWNTVAIHPNGDVGPCMTWMRPPIGNLWRQGFGEIWEGEAARALRDEFEKEQPGLDCLHCGAKLDAGDEEDGFYRMLAKKPAWENPA
jgi:radical SAM protein with 4Fe4S-binding SPASM domain